MKCVGALRILQSATGDGRLELDGLFLLLQGNSLRRMNLALTGSCITLSSRSSLARYTINTLWNGKHGSQIFRFKADWFYSFFSPFFFFFPSNCEISLNTDSLTSTLFTFNLNWFAAQGNTAALLCMDYNLFLICCKFVEQRHWNSQNIWQ